MKRGRKNLIRLLKGDLNATMAILTGKVKVSGNLKLAESLTSLFDMKQL